MSDFLSRATSIKSFASTPSAISCCLKSVDNRNDLPQRLIPVIIFTFPFQRLARSLSMYSCQFIIMK